MRAKSLSVKMRFKLTAAAFVLRSSITETSSASATVFLRMLFRSDCMRFCFFFSHFDRLRFSLDSPVTALDSSSSSSLLSSSSPLTLSQPSSPSPSSSSSSSPSSSLASSSASSCRSSWVIM